MSDISLEKKNLKKEGQILSAFKRMLKRPSAVFSMAVILIVILIAIFAGVLADWDTMVVAQNMSQKFMPPSSEHILGTDHLGRDVFARILHGSRTALLMGVVGSLVSIIISTILACFCAYFGGLVDNLIMRVVDVLSAIPPIIIALAICAGLGNGIPQLIVALSVGSIPIHTRMVRSYALTVAKSDYVEAATCLGAGMGRIMITHIIPNIISIIIIQFTGNISVNILMGATLSFIGLGVKAPQPEWGLMLKEGLNYMAKSPSVILYTAIALVITTVAINTFGDSLRDALDPQLKGKA